MASPDSTLIYLGGAPYLARPLPLMGTRICAGFPSPADDFLDGELDLTQLVAPNRPATFLWRVTGHSMRDVGIFDGALVVIDRSVKPFHGCAVVAVINGETSLKVYQAKPRPHLTFGNAEMPAFPMDEVASVQVWGVVTWVLHRPQRS